MVNRTYRACSIFALLLMATLINSGTANSQELKLATPAATPAVETVEASPQPMCTPPDETTANVLPASVAPESKATPPDALELFQPRNAVAPTEMRPKIFAEPAPVFSKNVVASSNDRQTSTGATQQATQQANARAPLTSGEKMERAFRTAFLRPAGYIRTAISAAITEATEEDLPHKTSGDRFADGLSRFAINFSTRSTRVLLGSGVYPSLFKQDPRYRPSDRKEAGARTLHALSRVFVTDGDNGDSQPNYSRLAGNFSAAALANIWERNTPRRERIGVRPTLRRFGFSLGFDALNYVVFQEFWPDIMRALGRK